MDINFKKFMETKEMQEWFPPASDTGNRQQLLQEWWQWLTQQHLDGQQLHQIEEAIKRTGLRLSVADYYQSKGH